MAFSLVETSPHDNSTSVVQNVFKILKVLLLSFGLISSVVMLKGAFLPFSCEFVFGFWNSLRCFLSSPLYICIIINSMVLLILALSNFQPHDPPPPPRPQKLLSTTEKCSIPSFDHDQDDDDDYFPEVKMEADQVSSDKQLEKEEEEDDDDDDDDDTMEATWKAISGGKAKQLTKSKTFIQAHSEEIPASSASTWKDLKKSETFNEAVSIRRRGGLRRDPSVGIDEFNQQVEAFIKKFNDDMRLQRQESDQRFMDMIKRGL